MTVIASPQSSRSARVARKRSPRCTDKSAHRTAGDALGRYRDGAGHTHEIIARPGRDGSVLIIDCNLAMACERRLVAHLSADEPRSNAHVVCHEYISNPTGRWCRSVVPSDLDSLPVEEEEPRPPAPAELTVDEYGRSYQLAVVGTRTSIREIRWVQRPPHQQLGPVRVLSLRDVIACLQSYEPARAMTRGALARHRCERTVSTSVLRGELNRVCASRIVLNRGLREAVQGSTETPGVSLSEIAMRCGRVKHDRRGNISGEASWLCRRLGLVPESGERLCTPWIHSEVLALIARRGLGVSPREVELG